MTMKLILVSQIYIPSNKTIFTSVFKLVIIIYLEILLLGTFVHH